MSMLSVNEFGQLVLVHLFQSQNYTGNIALSGQSFYIMLSIITAGVGERTRHKLSRLLHHDVHKLYSEKSWKGTEVGTILSQMSEVIKSTMTTKSAIFHSFSIRPRFMNGSKQLTDIEYHRCDLLSTEKVTNKINRWVLKNTEPTINGLYQDELENDTNMILITIMHFYSEWLVPFDPMKTKTETFTNNEGKELYVSMMNQMESYKIHTDYHNNFSIIIIPMKQNGMYATILLPDRGCQIQQTVRSFRWDYIPNYFHNAPTYDVELKIPKFKITTHNHFVNTLIDLNASEIFDPEKADLILTTRKNAAIKDLLQLTAVVVNEFGTWYPNIHEQKNFFKTKPESRSAKRPNRYQFFLDRPFLFLIYSSYSSKVVLSVIVNQPNYY
ncbi:putative serpin-like protein [Thelohanellus kitauei]|uniref:Putative serpin-like protein n=1 Tax=Thelohanellus kitauei TaxID=669202 RepID=A0A0C2N600_THEKT|nr:putative serpin-like protein [Thelohanellus kitauei]